MYFIYVIRRDVNVHVYMIRQIFVRLNPSSDPINLVLVMLLIKWGQSVFKLARVAMVIKWCQSVFNLARVAMVIKWGSVSF